MKFLKTYNVVPTLPEKLTALKTLAYNYWWCWNAQGFNIFRHMAPELWTQCEHNPVLFLSRISQERLENLTGDEGFLYNLEMVAKELQNYLDRKTWFESIWEENKHFQVAYFSAEFGINEGLPIYSGGLGVLAGDHLKSASDLGIPLVGVGLAYRQGYFRQYLNQDGMQQERYVENDFYNMPLILVTDENNQAVKVSLQLPGRELAVQIWKVHVGRVPLFLLDTNLPENSPEDRGITSQLYGGDKEMRIKQELVLGVGGVRALDRLGFLPCVTHMNEGHSAFLGLERIRYHMKKDQLSFAEAKELVAGSSIFTTHTPVPAGIDLFAPEMLKAYLSPLQAGLGLDDKTLLGLGRGNVEDMHEAFSMAILALNLSTKANGVAKLHGVVSRKMWGHLWPTLPEEEIPITHITNGVHANSWISLEMSELFQRYLGPRWVEEPGDQHIWERVMAIPSAELWRTHERRRERLVGYVRRRLREQMKSRGVADQEMEIANQVLDPEALTIGFARRFATYKRATLIFRDIERFVNLVNNKNRPVQFIFAGKAHPHDEPGKRLIQEIVHYARRPELRRHVVFLEDYDLNCAHYLLQGVDVWLNNPRRPLEASGTSGMKAIFNGGLNCSILDGWWDEGYNGENGWAIGRGEEYDDLEYQNKVESASLYQILENEIIPLFYDRGPDNIPENWIKKIKKSMTSLGPVFNTNRMVSEYTENLYIEQMERLHKLEADNSSAVKTYAAWKEKVYKSWNKVAVEKVMAEDSKEFEVGSSVKVNATVALGLLTPDDVQVEIVFGRVDGNYNMVNTDTVTMQPLGKAEGKHLNYEGMIPCDYSGNFGLTVRVLPKNDLQAHRFETSLVTWGQ